MVEFEKARLNVWTVGGLVVSMFVTAFGWGVTYNSFTTAQAATDASVNAIMGDLKEIKAVMPQVQYQVNTVAALASENKAGVNATNQRIDRVVESFGSKLDGIADSLNKAITRIEVLSSKMGEGNSRLGHAGTQREQN